MRHIHSMKIAIDIETNKESTHREFSSFGDFIAYVLENAMEWEELTGEDVSDMIPDMDEYVIALTQREADALAILFRHLTQDVKRTVAKNPTLNVFETLTPFMRKLADVDSTHNRDDGSGRDEKNDTKPPLHFLGG